MSRTPRPQPFAPGAVDQIFVAMGDATRRAIFRLVTGGPQTVSALAGALGVTLTAVAQHLAVLESCGLLRTRKQGRVRICEMRREALDVLAEWVALNRQMWEQRFDALDELLKEDDKTE
ncbi:transcriptional regulator, ArsR family [Duganella sp. CF517]|uniref:ArsR/SmtB family transcription factor n=1 Tax=Duganella sp. CF517 TaxID=1881038 RepID=UPI0008B932AF|nr:metalloregulator ArsR/SmtB family transcription factor [Duganella sp. CF517]SEN28773.1 transcriptional regulator, ArsR family [Duganella sp. CF517]